MSHKLLSLKVENFRNLADHKIEFNSKINCVFGENGNGKTNLLESIFYLINKKSFKKNTSFSQVLNIDNHHPVINIYSEFDSSQGKINYNFSQDNKKKENYINGKKTTKFDLAYCVFINPLDAAYFFQLKEFRRTWIDDYLSFIDPVYKSFLNHYQKALKQRKILLKNSINNNLIDHFEIILIENGMRILNVRSEFINTLNPLIDECFKKFFDEKFDLKLSINSSWINKSKEQLLLEMKESRQRDFLSNKSLFGIHRDDYIFYFNNLNAIDFCSLGQQKMCFLSLVFSYINHSNSIDKKPIILMDDVSGELDSVRWSNLVNYLKNEDFQIIITSANSAFQRELESILEAKIINVKDGTFQ